jgi:hypothetical protein
MECPFCKKDIKSESIKCKHCGSILAEFPPKNQTQDISLHLTSNGLSNRLNEREKVEHGQKAMVTDFDMSFWRRVTSMVKWPFEAIPPTIILAIIWTIITLVLGWILYHH